MNILFVKANKLILQEKEYELSDLFTDELFQFCDENISKYRSDLSITNEAYLSRIQQFHAIIMFLKKNKVELIELENPEDILLPTIVDAASSCGVKITGISKLFRFKRKISGHVNIIGSFGYLMWQMIKRPKSDDIHIENQAFSIIRTPAAKKKMAFLKDLNIKYENFDDKKTLYNCYSRVKRFYWVIKAWVGSYKEINKYSSMIRGFIGPYCQIDTFNYYSKRIVHTLLYGYMLEAFFAENKEKTFYTGNNLDRFAIIEERLAKKNQIKVVCIPHGLEYGFKLPHCFIGDKFYTTSEQAASHLNVLYDTSKFIYDFEIVQKMFSVEYECRKVQNIVFFTEPREVNVNYKIIDGLLPLMENQKMKLSIKLHPKDNKSDYDRYEKKANIIMDFNEAVSHNICFARKSTTLLEALYNNSCAGAILINQKDKAIFNTFPSLCDDKINTFYCISDLFDWLKSEFLHEKR